MDHSDMTKSDIRAIELEHVETSHTEASYHPKWKLSKAGGGDTALALFDNPEDVEEPIDPEQEKAVMKKVDRMILPYLAVCYVFFYVDKTSLSYAAIFGLKTDLNLHGTQYSWLSSIFYFGFLAFAFPTNFLMQRLPLAKYLSFNIMLWGVFLMLQAVSKNFTHLAILRAFGGAAEAVADPAFMVISASWYTRREQPVKIGLWYSANGVGIAFGGLLGYGIGQLKGSLPSWKYEFLIIGALCSAWGIVMFWFLPDSPITAKNFTIEERRIVVKRLRENQTGVENKQFKPYQIWEAFTDYKLAGFFLIALLQAIVNGGVSNFGTLIIQGFGYSPLGTSLLQIPSGALIAVAILSCVFINDRLPPNNRCLMIIVYLLPNIAGAFGMRFVPANQKVGRLICYYLTGSINACFVLLLSLQTANTAGHTKKVVTSAVLFLGYCTGNIGGPFFYKTSQAPSYNLGIWSMIVSHLLEVVVVLVLRFLLRRDNMRRDQIQGINQGQATERELEMHEKDLDATAFGDLTDRENLNFRYIY